MIECIIEHNMAHRLSDDDLDGDIIADGVEPYPRDVWTWGIQNRTGRLRTLPIDEVRGNFLLEAEALMTREGICFHGLHYTCDKAIQERWFAQVRTGAKGELTIPILYDPRTPDRVYLPLQENRRLEICWLHERGRANFEGCDWFDIEDMVARHMIPMATDMQNRQHRAKLQALRDRIIEEALSTTNEGHDDHAARIGQERETGPRDFPEQASTDVVGQPRPVFKGVAERLFALNRDKLFH